MSKGYSADICIAGGGIAGLAPASRLAPSGKKILILEQDPMITEEDRAVQLQFVQQVYTYLEICNLVADEPVFGECHADPLFFTRPPS